MDALGLTPELLLFQTPSDDCSTDCSNRPGAFCRLPIRDESDARYSSCSLQLTDVGGVVFDTVVAGGPDGHHQIDGAPTGRRHCGEHLDHVRIRCGSPHHLGDRFQRLGMRPLWRKRKGDGCYKGNETATY